MNVASYLVSLGVGNKIKAFTPLGSTSMPFFETTWPKSLTLGCVLDDISLGSIAHHTRHTFEKPIQLCYMKKSITKHTKIINKILEKLSQKRFKDPILLSLIVCKTIGNPKWKDLATKIAPRCNERGLLLIL